MRKIIFLTSLLFSAMLSGQEKAEQIKIYDTFDAFEKDVLNTAKKQPTLINFWATWCVPCMEEMPILLEIYRSEKYAHLNIVFVNMDFEKDIESKVKTYVSKERIISNTVVLNAPKPNQWIDKVSKKWSGALPFTLIFHNGQRATHEGKFHSLNEVEVLLNQVNFNKKR